VQDAQFVAASIEAQEEGEGRYQKALGQLVALLEQEELGEQRRAFL
jgi:hypothetical protein